MTQEKKKELIKDISARIPYGLNAQAQYYEYNKLQTETITVNGICDDLVLYEDYRGQNDIPVDVVKPYLRSYDSLTEDEQTTFDILFDKAQFAVAAIIYFVDWCNIHHIDYRDLINKGLAIQMPEEMYQEIIKSRNES